MGLHRLTSVSIGVPNVADTARYYTEFGLTPTEAGVFSTTDGGPQLRLLPAPTRRLVEIGIGVDDLDDLDRTADQLRRLTLPATRHDSALETVEPIAGFRAVLRVAPRLEQHPIPATGYNGPGGIERHAPGILRGVAVRPRKTRARGRRFNRLRRDLSILHRGSGVQDQRLHRRSGRVPARSTDHHNVLVLRAPVNFLNHLLAGR